MPSRNRGAEMCHRSAKLEQPISTVLTDSSVIETAKSDLPPGGHTNYCSIHAVETYHEDDSAMIALMPCHCYVEE